MAYITEDQKSRSLSHSVDSASATRIYNLVDYVDTDAALNALSNYIPVTLLVGNTIVSSPSYAIAPSFSDPNRTLFVGTVTWKSPEKSEAGAPEQPEDDTSFSFSFSSISDVKLYSDEMASYVASGEPNPNVTGINQQHSDAMPEGVEINKAIVTIEAKTVISRYTASNAWFKDRLDQVWTLNQSTWRSLPARSVAFTGLSGSLRTDGNWDITYSFEYRPDNSGQTFQTESGGTAATITTPDTRGWDYVWSAWDKLALDDNKTKRVIRSVNIVPDVYPTSDFNQLGMIGV